MEMFLGFVELEAMKMTERPTLDRRNIKSTKTLTPLEVSPQIEGNELNMPFILILFFCFFSCLFFGFFLLLFFACFDFFSFSFFLFSNGKEKH